VVDRIWLPGHRLVGPSESDRPPVLQDDLRERVGGQKDTW